MRVSRLWSSLQEQPARLRDSALRRVRVARIQAPVIALKQGLIAVTGGFIGGLIMWLMGIRP